MVPFADFRVEEAGDPAVASRFHRKGIVFQPLSLASGLCTHEVDSLVLYVGDEG